MFEQLIKKPQVILRLKASPFRKILEQYTSYLIENGYALSSSGQYYLQCVEHFTNWLKIKKVISASKIDKTLIKQFVYKHLSVCQCPPPAPCHYKNVRAALNNLLKMLKIEKIMGSNKKNTNAQINKVIDDFNNYLSTLCGLSEQTRHYRSRHVEIFLSYVFKTKSLRFNDLTPKKVATYFGDYAKNHRPNSFRIVASSLRSFFNFLQLKGLCTPALMAAIPRVANWKLSTLPHYLQLSEIKQLLCVCDQNTAMGKRDYAILRALIDLGMRTSEVAALTLEDIDWRKKVIYLPRGKSRQAAVLPMPLSLIEAFIDYLKNGRPASRTRHVFVFHQAPLGAAITTHGVRQTLRRAYLRAGIKPPSQGPHLLRKSFATHLLQKGATLKEISDLLRHQSINTTLIYTKVDLPHLAHVAAPWLWGAV